MPYRLGVGLNVGPEESVSLRIGVDGLDLHVQAVSPGSVARNASAACERRRRCLEQRADRAHPLAHAALISIFLPFASFALGRWTSSTPFLKVALTLSGSTPAGSGSVRAKTP